MAPVQIASSWWGLGAFSSERPVAFLDASHQRLVEEIRSRAHESDVLLVDRRDVVWLGVEHPGRLFVGHFFLTVRYADKLRRLERFLEEPGEQRAFLHGSGARFLFVNGEREPERFAALPELTPVRREPAGWLFEVRAPAAP